VCDKWNKQNAWGTLKKTVIRRPEKVVHMEDLMIDGTIYREVPNFINPFTTLRFTVTGAPPAARRIQILPMNKYA
jgi:hypothetical protein